MRITLVSDYFDARTGNPLAVFAKMLPFEKGNEIVVFASSIAEKPGNFDDSALKARIVRFRAIRIGKKAVFPGLIARILFEKDLGIVHTHVLGFFSFFACALLKPIRRYKLAVTPDFDARNPVARFPKTIINFFLMKFPLQQADLVLPFTELEKKELHARFGVREEKMRILPIGINYSMFEKKQERDYRKELRLQKKFVLLSACFLHKKKNLEMVLEAMKSLPKEIVLVHAGGFPNKEYEKKIDSIIVESGLKERVFFLGNKSLEEMIDAYKSADAFVQTGFNESYCIPIIEAMAAGLPVLTTRVGIASEAIIDGKNGFFIENAKELSTAVELLWKNPEIRESMAKANAEKAQQFDWQKLIAELQKEYERLSLSGNV